MTVSAMIMKITGFILHLYCTFPAVFAQPPGGFPGSPGMGHLPNWVPIGPPGAGQDLPIHDTPGHVHVPPGWSPLPEATQSSMPPSHGPSSSRTGPPLLPPGSGPPQWNPVIPIRTTRVTTTATQQPIEEEHDIQFPDIEYQHKPKFDYANALAKSMLFYEAQRSGALPYDHRVAWRGPSALNDGGDVGIDLSGGYYDGGGYVKYGFTMAYTTTVVSWGIIRYRRTYEAIGQLQHALNTIKWATDYFLRCKRGPTTFYGQVSDQQSDSSYGGVPESMTYLRKSYVLTKKKPGSELIAETAAALAAASIAFYETDQTYSELLIHNALDLYDFASNNRGNYHKSIRPADRAYKSHSGYKDELAWAAAWIYRRSGDTSYLRKAKSMYKSAGLKTMAKLFSWDDKKVGVQLLLAELTNGKQYKDAVQEFCNYCLPTGKAKHTPKGLLYVPVSNWGSLRYAANAAFICSLTAELDIDKKLSNSYRLFAMGQIDYILGSTGRSYVVGFGMNPPRKYYHKSSYCPNGANRCPDLSLNHDNAHVLYGALVGGPSETDEYSNMISNRGQSSVALDYNAGYQSALASVLDLYIFGRDNRPKLDKPGKISTPRNPAALTDEGVVDDEVVTYDYAQALHYSLFFYEAQRSGKLPVDNRIPWRSDSALDDGQEVKWDLSGGYYDGGDYVKYTFPLAFTMTMLSWGLIEFPDAYLSTESLNHAVDSLAWGANYLMKAHVEKQQIVITQVGDVYYESNSWDRPEYMNKNTSRPVKYLASTDRGSDVTSEMAAAFAAMSIAFQNMTSKDYRDKLINRAKSLFKLASTNRGIYSQISGASTKGMYDSTGYEDELAWAAMWIYKATADSAYLNYAKTLYNSDNLLTTPSTFSYDDKRAGLHLLFAENSDSFSEITKFCDRTLGSAKVTPEGLFYEGVPPTKHAGNVAFILLLAAHKFPTYPNANKWKYFGRDQINYILGSSGRSFMVGYGSKYPRQPYHKASSCPRVPSPCGDTYKQSSESNPQILYGAVVAGPDKNDKFQDVRTKKEFTGVSLDTNAGVQSSLAALYSLQKRGLLNGAATPSSLLSGRPAMVFFVLLGHSLFNKLCNF